MKKTYIYPEMQVMKIEVSTILAGSPGYGGSTDATEGNAARELCWRYPRGTVASSLEISNVRRPVRDERAVNSILKLRRSSFHTMLTTKNAVVSLYYINKYHR